MGIVVDILCNELVVDNRGLFMVILGEDGLCSKYVNLVLYWDGSWILLRNWESINFFINWSFKDFLFVEIFFMILLYFLKLKY